MSVREATARATAACIAEAHAAWDRDFRWITTRAARRFAARDWGGARADAAERFALYERWVQAAVHETSRRLGAARGDAALWTAMRDAYRGAIAARGDGEIAESFFNSVTRRMLRTVGIDARVEFRSAEAREPTWEETSAALVPLPVDRGPEGLARALLAGWTPPTPGPGGAPAAWADLEGDVARVAAALAAGAREQLGGWPDDADRLGVTFYRNKGAYLVARLRRGAARCPCVVALLHDADGLRADAVLVREEEASVVFGFAWSPFHVAPDGGDPDAVRPRALVALLASVLPGKRLDELYTAVGLHKHAKTELYRELVDHLARPDARFERAAGTRGLVMEVVTLPSLNVVFKLIRDRFLPPKRTTRRQVMAQYEYVLKRDRAGRLCDAQEFEWLAIPRARVPDALLAELQRSAPSVVREACAPGGEAQVLVSHCYLERRLTPLDLYLRGMDVDAAARAVDDYGHCLRDLAASGIFAGDLLIKNFGVSRHGRVIFYDYDELADLLACRFHALPDDDDESGMSAAHAAGDEDVFPEEFARFLFPAGPLRDAFLANHRELCDPGWWDDVQRRVRGGEVVDVYPYPQARRLRAAG